MCQATPVLRTFGVHFGEVRHCAGSSIYSRRESTQLCPVDLFGQVPKQQVDVTASGPSLPNLSASACGSHAPGCSPMLALRARPPTFSNTRNKHVVHTNKRHSKYAVPVESSESPAFVEQAASLPKRFPEQPCTDG